ATDAARRRPTHRADDLSRETGGAARGGRRSPGTPGLVPESGCERTPAASESHSGAAPGRGEAREHLVQRDRHAVVRDGAAHGAARAGAGAVGRGGEDVTWVGAVTAGAPGHGPRA